MPLRIKFNRENRVKALKRWWVRKGLGKEGGSVPGFALNTSDNNGVNVNRYDDDNDNDNVGASGSPLSPELLSPPFSLSIGAAAQQLIGVGDWYT